MNQTCFVCSLSGTDGLNDGYFSLVGWHLYLAQHAIQYRLTVLSSIERVGDVDVECIDDLIRSKGHVHIDDIIRSKGHVHIDDAIRSGDDQGHVHMCTS